MIKVRIIRTNLLRNEYFPEIIGANKHNLLEDENKDYL